MGFFDDIAGSVGGFFNTTTGAVTGEGAAAAQADRDRANARAALIGQGAAAQVASAVGQEQARDAIQGGFGLGRNSLEAGRANAFNIASGMYGQGAGALMAGHGAATGAYGQGQGALQSGLYGGLGQIAAGNAMAQGQLAPHIAQDAAARSSYADRLMGGLAGGDDPYWNRLAGQRTGALEASLAKQGLLGSSAGARAMADAGSQLQQAREQQFFDRAQGLFNANAASQAAGLSQQAGLAGSGLYGDMGRASAGMYGDQAQFEGLMGRAGADYAARGGEYLGGQAFDTGRGMADSRRAEAEHLANVFMGGGRDRGGYAMDTGRGIADIYTGQAGGRRGWGEGAIGTIAGHAIGTAVGKKIGG